MTKPITIAELRAEIAELKGQGGRYWAEDGWTMHQIALREAVIAELIDQNPNE